MVEKDSQRAKYLSPEEAVEYGIIDRVLYPEELRREVCLLCIIFRICCLFGCFARELNINNLFVFHTLTGPEVPRLLITLLYQLCTVTIKQIR